MIERAARTARFDGWYVVGAVFILLMVNSGLGFYGLSVFLEAITDEQGFSTAQVSFATSLFFIVSAVAGRVIAPVIQRRDLRLVVGAGAVIAAAGLILIGQSTRLVPLYASYIVFATGVGLSGLVPGTTLVTRWFHVRRSVALSVASTGLSVGGLTITVAASAIIDNKGMEGATPWLALIYLAVVSVSLLGLFPDPATRGQLPDGETPQLEPVVAAGLHADAATTTGIEDEDSAVAGRDAGPAGVPGISYADAVASMFFKLVTLGFIFAMASQVGGIAQLFKLGTERVDRATGTALVSVVAFTSVIARLIGGVVASRVPLVLMTAVLSVVQGGALFWLSKSESRVMLIASVVIFGATIGNLLMLQPLVIADRFGVVNYPKIFALCQLIVTGFGVAGGPYLLGWLHDEYSYTTSYAVAAVLSVVGAVVFFVAWRVSTAVSAPPTGR